MIAKINQLLQEVEALKAANAEELEALRIKYLSKKGAINDLMADFRNKACFKSVKDTLRSTYKAST